MSAIDLHAIETRIAAKVDKQITSEMSLTTNKTGGLAFTSMSEVIEFAKIISVSNVGVRKHLRGNVGACLAVTVQAIEWEMSPFAVANKSYLVNDQIAYEAQLINAIILRRAPILGRFRVEYSGTGDDRVCKVSARLRDEGDTVEYFSPVMGKITPKNSPLWKSDPDQQLFYYSSRALCRRHFPDVILGVYAIDELIEEDKAPQAGGPRDITPRRRLADRLDALTNSKAHEPAAATIPPVTAADEGAESVSLPTASAPDLLSDLIATGDARAAAGIEPLRQFLEELTHSEATLINEAQREAWAIMADRVDHRRGES